MECRQPWTQSSLSLSEDGVQANSGLSLKFSQCFSLHDPNEYTPSNCLICLLEMRVPTPCSKPGELLCLEMRPRNNLFFSVHLKKFSLVLKSGCHCLRYLGKWYTVLISKGLSFEWHHSAHWKVVYFRATPHSDNSYIHNNAYGLSWAFWGNDHLSKVILYWVADVSHFFLLFVLIRTLPREKEGRR